MNDLTPMGLARSEIIYILQLLDRGVMDLSGAANEALQTLRTLEESITTERNQSAIKE